MGDGSARSRKGGGLETQYAPRLWHDGAAAGQWRGQGFPPGLRLSTTALEENYRRRLDRRHEWILKALELQSRLFSRSPIRPFGTLLSRMHSSAPSSSPTTLGKPTASSNPLQRILTQRILNRVGVPATEERGLARCFIQRFTYVWFFHVTFSTGGIPHY